MIGVEKMLKRTKESKQTSKHFRSQMAVGLRRGQRKRVAQLVNRLEGKGMGTREREQR
jgi:ABC-type siderophore export system fused ATPase/permease subunit